MNIKFRRRELVFTVGENTEVDVSQIGDNQYMIAFTDCNIQKKTILPNDPLTPPVTKIIEVNDNEVQKTKINENIKSNEKECPSVAEIVEYFRSINDLTHIEFNNTYLQEQLLGSVLNTKKEPNLYHKFIDRVRKAKDIVANERDGHWEDLDRVNLGNNRHPKAFKFVKHENKID